MQKYCRLKNDSHTPMRRIDSHLAPVLRMFPFIRQLDPLNSPPDLISPFLPKSSASLRVWLNLSLLTNAACHTDVEAWTD